MYNDRKAAYVLRESFIPNNSRFSVLIVGPPFHLSIDMICFLHTQKIEVKIDDSEFTNVYLSGWGEVKKKLCIKNSISC